MREPDRDHRHGDIGAATDGEKAGEVVSIQPITTWHFRHYDGNDE